jgi:hypothetical protein
MLRTCVGAIVVLLCLSGTIVALPPAAPPAAPTAADHPGSATYAYGDVDTTSFVKKPPGLFSPGFLTRVHVPRGASGKLPVVAIAHGKFLYYDPDLYGKLIRHLCLKGCVVVDVEYEGYLAGLFTKDHARFAERFRIGVREAIQRTPVADPTALVYVGHSLGARVALIAAEEAAAKKQSDPVPTALVLHAFDDSRPPTGAASPEVLGPGGVARRVPANVEVTLVEYADDTIAGPSTPYARLLYAELPVSRKQWLRVPGLATQPALVADHLAPLTGGSSFGFGGKPALDAIDQHVVWKITAGVALARTGRDPRAEPWCYGTRREDCGVASDGTAYKLEVIKSSF